MIGRLNALYNVISEPLFINQKTKVQYAALLFVLAVKYK
jgi:hypothetical protein